MELAFRLLRAQSSPLRAVGAPGFRHHRYGGSQDYREGWRKNHLFFKKKCVFFSRGDSRQLTVIF
ncbi:hypothetical protein EIZ48_13485 [Photobacterium alginatilyticum]|uniref:Uncharacterized protein n=1 Tax=Photobacterium alginatilyticum TaxID=1775171 RepID=A0ABW9YID8_9GAMM|nr:hypothetical protein [Photobacterium alginatilyticum]